MLRSYAHTRTHTHTHSLFKMMYRTTTSQKKEQRTHLVKRSGTLVPRWVKQTQTQIHTNTHHPWYNGNHDDQRQTTRRTCTPVTPPRRKLQSVPASYLKERDVIPRTHKQWWNDEEIMIIKCYGNPPLSVDNNTVQIQKTRIDSLLHWFTKYSRLFLKRQSQRLGFPSLCRHLWQPVVIVPIDPSSHVSS